MSKITFREVVPTGDLAVTYYLFRVDAGTVKVKVHLDAVRTVEGEQLLEEEVRLAARTLIQLASAKAIAPAELTLDRETMYSVGEHHCWLRRLFGSHHTA
ncbi:MAG TPA: hypothetical protein VKU44_03440 [Terriglobia bacterium]|nr:hypothetical protein [Terriglobia bacterium]